MKVTKRAVEVDAHRIGDDGWPDAIWEGVVLNKIILHLETMNGKTVGYVLIQAIGGQVRAEVGDWIIRGVAGEFYPCKPDIFQKTYTTEKREAGNARIRFEDMAPHQQRVVEELNELEEKIRKLTRFAAVPNVVFDHLDRAEQRRLKMQYLVMQVYADILQDRIEHF